MQRRQARMNPFFKLFCGCPCLSSSLEFNHVSYDFNYYRGLITMLAVHKVDASFGIKKADFEERQRQFLFEDIPVWDSRFRERMDKMTLLLTETCRKVVENKEFLNWLVLQKFDLAFSYMFDVCPIGLIHYAKIPSWIWLSTGGLLDHMAYYMGVPTIPSYVPTSLMDSTDQMDFVERVKSFVGHTLIIALWKRLFADRETEHFRRLIDPHFPDIVDIAKKCPLVMLNSNELYEAPRPTLSKIVNIGGVGVEFRDANTLPDEFLKVVNASVGLVVFSFGSVTPTYKMPLTWKKAFLDAFKHFPEHRFIMKYEDTDLQGHLPSNVNMFKWLPQSDLLAHPKTKAFISHGGYNSIQEAIITGVPLVTIPLFGDQPKNAKWAEKHRIAVNLRKNSLTVDAIVNALEKILTDQSYTDNIKRLSRMVKKRPVKSEHLLVAWAEFVAEFKTLENLVPAGNNLNFFQYHSLDVIAFLFILLISIVFVVYKLLLFVIAKLFRLLGHFWKQKKA
ncbi:hypothetical protein KIN20_025794 [Parelaphostrongylus tenuis]|uniref:UDP-glucuronosyltransferase n=1 Tax=Parelaphostrongylus tenuis TaxID=148309 RepID=A0AAD5N9R1_PARTN|nr:hypothetical protein KIN20_025794 [Parelaphostrongylus tenuis]